MFANLKTKNPKKSVFKNSSAYPDTYHKSPGATTSSVRPDEGDRLFRCKICGFVCDRDKITILKEGSYAGIGVKYSEQKTAAASIGDARTPAAGTVTPTPDKYYTRDVKGGCPCCGTFIGDPQGR